MKTSITHPLRVDFLPAEPFEPGRIGLTFAPGKRDPHAPAGPWVRDLELDLERLRQHWATDVLVTLLEGAQRGVDELALLEIPALLERAAAHGIEPIWFPIADGRAPASIGDTLTLVDSVLARARAGKTVVIHCRGGLGRAGTMAACCLVARAHQPAQAIATVRRARSPLAVETREQELFVRDFADAWAGLGRP